MIDFGELQVHTIYAADPAAPLGLRMRLLGLLSFLVALIGLYLTWGKGYVWIQQTLTLAVFSQATGTMSNAPNSSTGPSLNDLLRLANPPPAAAVDEKKPADGAAGDDATAKAEMVRTSKVRGGLAVGWLAFTTLVCIWLLIAGVAAGTNFASWARRPGLVVAPLAVGMICLIAWYVWREYQWYETLLPRWVVPTMLALLVVAGVAIGSIVNRHGLRLQRIGAVLVILSACVSVGAIYAAVRWGQMPSDHVDFSLYAGIFGKQSAYGWFLLLATIGLK